ncbi:hypothetical protein ABT301_32470 [Streptomyces sp. NPDC000987]|uniref:hypothetical protein n=1 Tax=Streptomyces sp. NPDC000987 TaxID=3154374 RepID=UPI003322A41A
MARQLTAAAARYSVKTANSRRGGGTKASWQEEAWRFFKEVPEVRFAGTWVGNAMSGATLFAGRRADDGTIERAPDTHPAAEIVREIAGGPDGQSMMLGDFGPHLVVAGEGWIVVRPTVDKADLVDGYDWRVLSTREVKQQGGGKLVAEIDGEDVSIPPFDPDSEPDPLAPIAIRVWEPSPDRHIEADSPVRSSLVLLEELQLLNAAVAAVARSRITGRGVLLVPKGTRFPTSPGQGADAEDDLLEVFLDVASTAIREPDSAAATVPIILEVPSEVISDIKWLSFESNFDELALKLRDEAIRRFANGLEVPAEILLGLSDANHWCVDERTEILTRDRGWITQDQLAVGDVVRTLNHETGLAEWQPVRDIYRAAVHNEPMRQLLAANHSSLTTAEHRWPVVTRSGHRKWKISKTLMQGESFIAAAPHSDLPTSAKYEDAFVELVAWAWTEGSIRTGGTGFSIAQSHTVNFGRVERIRRALTRLYGPASATLRGSTAPTWREATQANETSHGGPVTVFYLNQHATALLLDVMPGKRVSTDFVLSLTMAQLELFIDVFCQGDGWHYRHGKLDIWQRDPAALDAFELALTLSGRRTSRHEYDGGESVSALLNPHVRPVKAAAEAARIGRNSATDEWVLYTGTVWCPVTDNTTWFARRDGHTYFTGNSAWAISAEAVRLGVEPRLAVVCYALTTQWLRPLLEDQAVDDPGEWLVWYDTSQLRVQANRAQTALEAFQAGLISAAAARRETGFDESDAPEPSEDTTRDPRDPADTTDEETPSNVTTLPVGETTSIPDTLPASAGPRIADGLVAAVDVLIWAALAAAGERIRNKPACPRSERARARDIQPGEVHTVYPVDADMIDAWRLLDGAWVRVPEVAARYGLDSPCLVLALDDYVRALIAARMAHRYEETEKVVRLAHCAPHSEAA